MYYNAQYWMWKKLFTFFIRISAINMQPLVYLPSDSAYLIMEHNLVPTERSN